MLNYVEKFYRDGSVTINVGYQAIVGSPIICLHNGLWYKFRIDSVEEQEDLTYNITTQNLIAIKDKIIVK